MYFFQVKYIINYIIMNNFVMGAIVLVIIILLIFLLVTSGILGYDESESFVIDLPETDWYNFDCNSPNIRFRTKDALETLTKKEILNRGGKQEDINLMDLQIENISSGYGNSCNVIYNFRTPEHGEWTTNTAPRVKKIKTIIYQTVQYDIYGGYGYDYEYPWYSRPWMGWRWGRMGGMGRGRGGRRWGRMGGMGRGRGGRRGGRRWGRMGGMGRGRGGGRRRGGMGRGRR